MVGEQARVAALEHRELPRGPPPAPRRPREVPDRHGDYGFGLYDHEKRLASRDYFIVNPLGTVDVLDTRRSKIVWSKEVPGEIVAIDAMVLEPSKLAQAPPILRVREEPRAILVEQAVADALGELELTNVYGEEIPIAS